MSVTAADVKKLREATDAPLLECRSALQEAEGDIEKAINILREKGRSAAAKRAGRETGAGAVSIALSDDKKTASAIVLESETDFVARNEEFIKLADDIASAFLSTEPGTNPLEVSYNGNSIGSLIEGAVAKIRENIQLKQAHQVKSKCEIGVYVHHDKAKGAIVKLEGDVPNLSEVGKALATQCVAFPPKYLSKEDIPSEIIEKEIAIETERAIQEGKKPEIAANIAKGRVNKEYVNSNVLLEQPFYKDGKKSVRQYLEEEAKAQGGSIKVVEFKRLAVGE